MAYLPFISRGLHIPRSNPSHVLHRRKGCLQISLSENLNDTDAWWCSAADGNYTNSTLFVDVTGPLSGVSNSTNLTSSTATSAISSQASAVSETVKAGYIVRASADWNVSCSVSPPCAIEQKAIPTSKIWPELPLPATCTCTLKDVSALEALPKLHQLSNLVAA